jgi:cytochrome P450
MLPLLGRSQKIRSGTLPERFINPSDANNPKALVLFGGGVRICPGRKLAMIMLKVLMVTLIHRFDFELVNPDEPIRSKFAIFNLPDELHIRIKKRAF